MSTTHTLDTSARSKVPIDELALDRHRRNIRAIASHRAALPNGTFF
ncbi:hypothetical protein [Caballeronia sp. INML2]|jgi:hypothetical protein|nr:hypothetical protein [Caballeronia sp. INML2]